jgi:toxin-antitoxin system PIN domain toxin
VRALLDVNVLVALLDAAHVHHRAARDWLAAHVPHGWSSCTLTQNGCLRILSLPAYPNPQPTAVVAQCLAQPAADASHAFWPDTCSRLEAGPIRWERVLGSRQTTDAYLLALGAEHGGRLVTFDRGIAVKAVRGAVSKNIVTLSAA